MSFKRVHFCVGKPEKVELNSEAKEGKKRRI